MTRRKPKFKVGQVVRSMNRVHFESVSAEWGTPQRLFDELDREFHFTRDVCASRENFKVTSYWDKADNALAPHQKWQGVMWMNPPYGRAIGMWLKKAAESRATATTVCLIPARTDTVWWHRWVLMADEIRFVKGRFRFQGAKDGAPFPSCIVIFKRVMPTDVEVRDTLNASKGTVDLMCEYQAGR